MKYLLAIFTTIIAVGMLASNALAAKPEKNLICHVGNEVGPGGEVYLDDPGCMPHEDNSYFCPDAGKIDLIEVAKQAKHLGNDAHSYDGISDYQPGELGASGEGKEDSDDNGIDDGCEPPDLLLTCPCWNTYTEAELVVAINAQPSVELICQDETWEATLILDVAGYNPSNTRLIAFAAPEEPEEPPFCEFEVGESGLVFHFLDTATTSQCKQEISGMIPMIHGWL